MRIISGSARGLRLQSVPGMGTRPTTDRVKESVFNIIQMQVQHAVALDLFAGTGQLGVEALSRGAVHCDFVEHTREACQIIAKNLKAARLSERAQIFCKDAKKFMLTAQKRHYDLIFLDPPYGGQALQDALSLIERFDILSINGIIICESSEEDVFLHEFSLVKDYQYGATRITVLKRDG